MRTTRIGGLIVAASFLIAACADDGGQQPNTPAATQPAAAPTTSGTSLTTSTPATLPGPTTTLPEPTTSLSPPTTSLPPTTTGGTDTIGTDPVDQADAGYYLAIGDSYAVGYLVGVGPSTDGFVDGVVEGAADAGRPLQLVNVGCSGATTASLIGVAGCAADSLAPGAAPYDSITQIDAAVEFLEAHPGEVALITVSIGGNDVIPCAITGAELVACVTTATATVVANLETALSRIRAAAPDALIVGTTYPDIALGAWVTTFPGAKQRATESVVAFRDVINPALRDTYAAAGGRFVDVTEATGGYGSLDETTVLDPYGEVPTPVAQVCTLTAFCSNFDIHPTVEGYAIIADLVLAEYLA